MTNAIDTYKEITVGKFSRALSGIRHRFGQIVPVCLTVNSGLHAGLSLVLDKTEFSIGDQLTNDVMLLDQHMSIGFLTITNMPSLLGPVIKIETDRSDVFVNGARYDVGSFALPERLPVTLNIGSTDINIGNGAAQTFDRSFAMAAVLIVVGGLSLGTAQFLSWRDFSSVSLALATAPVHEDIAAGVVLIQTRQSLIDTKLNEYLTVSEEIDGTITVSGVVPPALSASWQEAQRLIDRATNGTPVRSNVRLNSNLPNLPPMTAVRTGTNPQLILANGSRLGIDGTLGEGWIIQDITGTSVTVARGDERIEIGF